MVETFGRDEGRDSSDVSGRAEKEAVLTEGAEQRKILELIAFQKELAE